MRIIHLEDSVDKHMEICRELKEIGGMDVAWVTNLSESMKKIEVALQAGRPFDLAITDMHYPIKRGEIADWETGERLIQTLTEKNITLSVIVCSTRNYRISGAYGCIWYSNLSDWEMDLKALVEQRKKDLAKN